MTLKDVATKVNVAVKTVSRVFNGNPSVRPYLRDRVLKAARDLDYRPNLLARGLRKKNIDIISLMVKDLENNFYGLLDMLVEMSSSLLINAIQGKKIPQSALIDAKALIN